MTTPIGLHYVTEGDVLLGPAGSRPTPDLCGQSAKPAGLSISLLALNLCYKLTNYRGHRKNGISAVFSYTWTRSMDDVGAAARAGEPSRSAIPASRRLSARLRSDSTRPRLK
jgi:hypothetical protein